MEPISSLIRFARSNRQSWTEVTAARAWTNTDDEKLSLYASFVSPGALVYDVGANIGNRVKIFSALGGSVIAFEPQPYCVAVLRKAFRRRSNITIVPRAVGSVPGSAKMFVSDTHVLSSMSRGWIDSVKRSGRFSAESWSRSISIEVTTLDQAIAIYGVPSFIKIDVEGFEFEVLTGLRTAVPALSFEFTPEHGEALDLCLDRLTYLGDYRFELSMGESMTLHLRKWVDARELKEAIRLLPEGSWGDIYARRT
jgi:FkbM family methyltransferase